MPTERPAEFLLNRLDSLRRLMELNAPDPILARCAASIVRSMTLLWPGLWTEIGKDMQRELRNSVGLCSQCGETEIPALLTHPVECRRCHEAHETDMRENYKIDPHEPHPPDVEEILVDLTNDECKKINNLPEDFVDGLERMLESREQEPSDAE